MYQIYTVKLHQRVVVFAHGLPSRLLRPGRHTVWGFDLTHLTLDTRELLFDVPPEVRALLPEGSHAEANVGPLQRGALYRAGRPEAFLRPGVHHYWTVDPSVELHLFDVREAVPDLSDELLAIAPRGAVVEALVQEFQRGLLYVAGRFERVLEPGRYVYWTRSAAPVSVRLIDMRRTQLTVAGQELLTRDKVTLRMSLTVDWAPMDPTVAAHTIVNPETALYTLVQLSVREFVAGVTLDELLEGRDELTRHLRHTTEPEAARFGVRVVAVGVKDIVLPGDMKLLLNRVIEAEKQAAANVILRKEEAAATRAMANAARVMADQPVLLRLKELESLERIASQVGEIKLSLGADELTQLVPSLRRLAE